MINEVAVSDCKDNGRWEDEEEVGGRASEKEMKRRRAEGGGRTSEKQIETEMCERRGGRGGGVAARRWVRGKIWWCDEAHFRSLLPVKPVGRWFCFGTRGRK